MTVLNDNRGLFYIFFAILAIAIGLAYALYTDHIWEDFFITFKHSKNLCEGRGLVYHPGERVHGFTSPLGVLLPAFCYWATGSDSYAGAIWLFRFFAILAFAGGCLGILQSVRESRVAFVFTGLLYALESKAVVFSGNGMETPFLLLFLAWAWYFLRDGGQKYVWLGACWAGLMWTRPDSCVYIAALSIAVFVFTDSPRRQIAWNLARAAIVTTLIYLPWFIWAWWYYGSPVPQTVAAKSSVERLQNIFSSGGLAALSWFERTSWIFAPTYANSSSWPLWIRTISTIVGLFCCVYWIFPRGDRLARQASFVFFALSLYMWLIAFPYPWYLPPIALIGLVALVRGLLSLSQRFSQQAPRLHWLVVLLLILLCIAQLWVLLLVTRQMEVRQREVEYGIRRQIGVWLKQNVQPDETVYLECLGYIGYFSEAKMLDYPGLVSPQVVRIRREKNAYFASVPAHLQPDWLVIRPIETKWMREEGRLLDDYELIVVFNAQPRLKLYEIYGQEYLDYDSQFNVYRRKSRKAYK